MVRVDQFDAAELQSSTIVDKVSIITYIINCINLVKSLWTYINTVI